MKRRSEKLSIRMSQSDRASLDQQAEAAGTTATELVRQRLFHDPAPSVFPTKLNRLHLIRSQRRNGDAERRNFSFPLRVTTEEKLQVADLARATDVSVSEYGHYVLFPPPELVLDEDPATLADDTGELAHTYAGAEGPDGTGDLGEPVELPDVAASAGAVAAQPVNAVATAAGPLPKADAIPVSRNRKIPSKLKPEWDVHLS